jgi:hypothetical protein
MFPMLMSNIAKGEPADKLFDKEGYVITNEGEKLNGILSLRRDKTYDEVKIKFTDSEGNKFTYKADMIKEFAFRDIQDDEAGNRVWKWNYFVSKKVEIPPVPFGPKEVFMERVVEGNVNLYQYWIQVNKDVENPYKREFYLERGTEWVKLTEENYIDEAKKFFSDYEELAIQMGQVNHRFRHMENVAKQYNTWLNKQANF